MTTQPGRHTEALAAQLASIPADVLAKQSALVELLRDIATAADLAGRVPPKLMATYRGCLGDLRQAATDARKAQAPVSTFSAQLRTTAARLTPDA